MIVAASCAHLAGGSLFLAIPVALFAGLVSFLSPCVLPLVPGYLSYVTGLSGADLAGTAPSVSDGPGTAVATHLPGPTRFVPVRARVHGRLCQ